MLLQENYDPPLLSLPPTFCFNRYFLDLRPRRSTEVESASDRSSSEVPGVGRRASRLKVKTLQHIDSDMAHMTRPR